MRVYLCCLFVFGLLLGQVDAQKGGAKGAMRGGGGGRRTGGGASFDDDDDEFAAMREKYDYTKERPCVGMCFLRKLAKMSGPEPTYPPLKWNRTPCVGMCFRNNSTGEKEKARREKRKKRKPCTGLCYLAKLNKTSTMPTVTKSMEEVENMAD